MEETIIIEGRRQKPSLAFILLAVFFYLPIILFLANSPQEIMKSLGGILLFAVLGTLFLVIFILGMLRRKTPALTVTNLRVSGICSRNVYVELPVGAITAVSMGPSNSLLISTPAGTAIFKKIENYGPVHREITNLLLQQRQTNTVPAVVIQQEDSADQIRKFKELLDSGIITQEEFEEKKKQLLGL